jgi:hypothetical protein
MSIVLKVKQIQNLMPNQDAVEKWKEIREEEIERRMGMMQDMDMEGNDDPAYYEKQREILENEEDWRGY